MSRLIETAPLRALALTTSALLSDNQRATPTPARNLFAARPRIDLFAPRPAAGISLRFAAPTEGTGSLDDDDEATVQVYAGLPVAGSTVNNDKAVVPDERVRLLGTLALVFGTLTETVWVGDGKTGSAQTVRWADAAVWTAAAYGTFLTGTIYGAAGDDFSPGSNGLAELLLPQLPGVSSVVLDGQVGSGTATVLAEAVLIG